MTTILGWIGSVCFAFCGAPLALQCYRQGNAKGVAPLFVILWLLGELCYIVACWIEFGFVIWLMANYFLNIFWILIVLRYFVKPRS